MVFRVRKLFGTFENRAPALIQLRKAGVWVKLIAGGAYIVSVGSCPSNNFFLFELEYPERNRSGLTEK